MKNWSSNQRLYALEHEPEVHKDTLEYHRGWADEPERAGEELQVRLEFTERNADNNRNAHSTTCRRLQQLQATGDEKALQAALRRAVF